MHQVYYVTLTHLQKYKIWKNIDISLVTMLCCNVDQNTLKAEKLTTAAFKFYVCYNRPILH